MQERNIILDNINYIIIDLCSDNNNDDNDDDDGVDVVNNDNIDDYSDDGGVDADDLNFKFKEEYPQIFIDCKRLYPSCN